MTDPQQPRVLRVSEPKDAAIAAEARYFAMYEWFAESAQIYAGSNLGFTVASTAVMFMVAADAERTDPAPSKVPDCGCRSCIVYRLLGSKEAPAMESLS